MINAKVAVVISNNSDSLALKRAKSENIPSYHLSAKKIGDEEQLGMYGMNVHSAVIAAHETETGVTIHRVNSEYDSGEIVSQAKVPVKAEDTAETLADRVLEREHTFLIEVIPDIISGKIALVSA